MIGDFESVVEMMRQRHQARLQEAERERMAADIRQQHPRSRGIVGRTVTWLGQKATRIGSETEKFGRVTQRQAHNSGPSNA